MEYLRTNEPLEYKRRKRQDDRAAQQKRRDAR